MKKFANELAELHCQISDMADLTKSMLRIARSALEDPTAQIRDQIWDLESAVDQAQIDIDHEVVKLMTLYSPVATDLRNLIVTMHVTSQLERIADQVINVTQTLELMDSGGKRPNMSDLLGMEKTVSEMFHGALNAFFERDVHMAQVIWAHDDLVDAKNEQIVKKLLSDHVLDGALKGSEDIADKLAQILLARHLERIADQSANICNEVIYLVKGHDVRHEHLPR